MPSLPKKGAAANTSRPATTNVSKSTKARDAAPQSSGAARSGSSREAPRATQPAMRSGQARASGQMRPRSVPQKQSGFSLRPMDIALIVMGVLIVGAIIAGGLLTANTSSPGTSSSGLGPSGSAGSPAGQPAPDFTLPASDGKTYSLSQFVGKPVVIEFFAPWCPHCQEDVPMFNELYDAYNSKGVEFLAVSATPFGRNYQEGDQSPITMEDVAWFKDTFQVKFPMLFDGELKSATDYNIEYYPTVYVINSDGTIAEKLVGERENPLSKERIAASIDKSLE